ncbi:LacI family DNA-binding transcriptional regulator [Arachidicoccus ginsenosidivorans]|jgi:LacI family transcriptional regulator|uniref:LacI family transcriptional regulator n=1 Tax=Arachidicoccus ginsenosidivorans TaxID=496057 RepID=A0A5B8VNI0_9BACT|nr:substrate-binding domain-containing protein [Arachidicoccus ginsenosidivorans]QEC72661.1 LacI family transcriptional regulator [Arachidicoccus ginsenosidivorans]
MNRKTSLKDIAEHLGVSTALVSYVINHKEKQFRVGPEMVKKIRKAAIEMNYQPNLVAKSLKSGQTKTIGLIVADISNPFFSMIARLIEDEARKQGYVVFFGSSDENAQKSQSLSSVFLNRQVDGFIIAPAEHTEDQILALQNTGKPVVLIDRYFPGLPADIVRINNAEIAQEAVSHLISKGRKNIAVLTYKTTLAHITDRTKGYQQALKKHGLKANKALICEASYQDIETDVERQLLKLFNGKHKVDAIFFVTNSLAVLGLKIINRLGIKVPDELAIVSFDQSDAFDFFYAPLSYVSQCLHQLGAEAVSLLVKKLQQLPYERIFESVIVEAKLVIRDS